MLPTILGMQAADTLKSGVSSLTGSPLSWLDNLTHPEIIHPNNTSHGSTYSAYATSRYDFRCFVLAPSDDDIKALDDFFESYGYNVSRFQVPKLNVRGTFTFIKTRDAVVSSDNYNASQQMAAMLNNGCKFWTGEIGE